MYELRGITSLDDPALAPYRTLRKQVDHHARRIFVAEGEKVVRRLLESPWEVVSVVLPPGWVPYYEPLLRARPEALVVYVVEKPLLEQLTGYSYYQGVMAVGRVPAPPSLAGVLAGSRAPQLLVAVDGLTNAENVGAIVRTAAALGATALLTGPTTSSPFLRRAVRSSMGAVFQLPVIEAADLPGTLRELGALGIRCVAAHPREGSKSLPAVDLRGPVCLVFGAEGEGLSGAVLAACGEAAAIPMANGVDSLNVGGAAAAFLYEAARQRGQAGR
jgi:tRNA G18 (ribose-2'-O)-methylase SpoU